jgi:hypothetical protein
MALIYRIHGVCGHRDTRFDVYDNGECVTKAAMEKLPPPSQIPCCADGAGFPEPSTYEIPGFRVLIACQSHDEAPVFGQRTRDTRELPVANLITYDDGMAINSFVFT